MKCQKQFSLYIYDIPADKLSIVVTLVEQQPDDTYISKLEAQGRRSYSATIQGKQQHLEAIKDEIEPKILKKESTILPEATKENDGLSTVTKNLLP